MEEYVNDGRRNLIIRRPTALSGDELRHYLRRGQSDHMAFLTAKASARGIAETLSAMANANGGLLLLGVSKGGTPQKDVDPSILCNGVAEASLLADPPLILPSPQVIELGDAARRSVVGRPGTAGLTPHLCDCGALFDADCGPESPLDHARTASLTSLERGIAALRA